MIKFYIIAQIQNQIITVTQLIKIILLFSHPTVFYTLQHSFFKIFQDILQKIYILFFPFFIEKKSRTGYKTLIKNNCYKIQMSQQEKTVNPLPIPQSFKSYSTQQPNPLHIPGSFKSFSTQQPNSTPVEAKQNWWHQLSKIKKAFCIAAGLILLFGAVFAVTYFTMKNTMNFQKEQVLFETRDNEKIKQIGFEFNLKRLLSSKVINGKYVIVEKANPDNSTHKEKYLALTDQDSGIALKSFAQNNFIFEFDLDQMLINYEKSSPAQAKRLLAQAALLGDTQNASDSDNSKVIAQQFLKAVKNAVEADNGAAQMASKDFRARLIDYYIVGQNQKDSLQSNTKKSSRLLYMLNVRNLRFFRPKPLFGGIVSGLIRPSIGIVVPDLLKDKGTVQNIGPSQVNSGNTNWTNISNNITNINITNIATNNYFVNSCHHRLLQQNSATQFQQPQQTKKRSAEPRRLRQEENPPQNINKKDQATLSSSSIEIAAYCNKNIEGERQCPQELFKYIQSSSSQNQKTQYSRSLYVVQVVSHSEGTSKNSN